MQFLGRILQASSVKQFYDQPSSSIASKFIVSALKGGEALPSTMSRK